MKKKFLVPILGVFVFALAFSFSTSTASSNDEIASLFVASDNIAYAENDCCLYRFGWICVCGNSYYYDSYFAG